MPRLVIKLSGTEYDMLTEYATTLRRTPSAQAEQIVADAVAELLRLAAASRGRGVEGGAQQEAPSAEANGRAAPDALAPEQEVGTHQG